MKKNNFTFIVHFVLLMLLGEMYGQEVGVTFNKSHRRYIAKRYIIRKDFNSFYKEKLHIFKLYYSKKIKRIENIDLHPLFLHYKSKKKRIDYLSFNGDTIFYYNELKDSSISKRNIFCVLNSNWEDTVKIELNQITLPHSVFYETSYYYSPINDTVHSFQLYPYYPSSQQIVDLGNGYSLTIDSDFIHYGTEIKGIGISKKYGFVWIKYKYENLYYEVYYY